MSIDASLCGNCGRAVVPPRDLCPYCGPRVNNMTATKLEGRGEVLSHTMLHNPPEGFDAPLKIALVSLQHEAVVLCVSKSTDDDAIEIGDQVTVVLGEDERFFYSLSK
ncbi:MAG: OB-fold domain-containing protein [Candidatus Thorarchaeota archaeon]|nr:MAG: OB-fold domain-containing protein [Candidatus Thorarchaeota archaeon]